MIRPTLIYLSTVAAGQAASLVLLPVMTKFLAPAEFGEYTLVLAITALVGAFGSSWVRNVTMRLYFDHLRDGRTRSLFWTAAALQAVTMATLLGVGYVVVLALGQGVTAQAYAAGGLSVLIADFYTLSINSLRAGQRSGTFGAAEFTSAGTRVAGTWLGLLAGFRSPAMLFLFASASVLVAQAIAIAGLRSVLKGPATFDRRDARDLVRLGLPSIPHSVGAWVMNLSDRALLAHFMGLGAVGLYSVAYSISDRAVSGLMAGLYLMTWPSMLHAWSVDAERAPAAISRYLGAYVALTTGPAVLLILEREFVLSVLASDAYVGAAGVVPYVVVGAWLTGVAAYLNRPLELDKRYATLSVITMAAAALNVGLNLVLIPAWGVLGAAISTMCACAGLVVLSAILGARVVRVPIPWGVLATAAVASGAAALASAWLPSPPFAIVAFGLVYALIVGGVWFRTARVGHAVDVA